MESNNNQRAPGRRLNRRVGFGDYVKTSAIAVATAAPLSALADFSGDYALTPPANGSFADASTNGTFGSWTGTRMTSSGPPWFAEGHTTLSTLLAPDQLSMSGNAGINDEVTNNVDYTFLVTAAASGLVSFDYVRTSSLTFVGGSDLMFVNQTTNQAVSLTEGAHMFSANVSAGDIFGFHLFFQYPGSGSLTITNFSAPEPTNNAADQGSTLALLTFGFIGLLAYRANSARRSSVCG
jgi:hypothetical protein